MKSNTREYVRLKWQYTQWLIYFLLSFIIFLTAIIIILNPDTLKRYIAGANTPVLLLKGYADWYKLLETACVIIIPFIAISGVLALIFYIKNRKNPKYASVKMRVRANGIPFSELRLVIFMILFFYYILSVMLSDLAPHEKYQNYMDEITALHEGNLITEEVWIHQETYKTGFALHGQNYPKPLTEYRILAFPNSDGKTGGWHSIYIPDFFTFTPDMEHPFKESQSLEWNMQYAAAYRVTYTPEYKLIISIERISQQVN